MWRWLQGLLDRLRALFAPAPKPLVREVSRLSLGAGERDADASAPVVEVVDTTGGPLKPNHRRRALRDPRLLPKPPAPQPIHPPWERPKKQPVMSAEEADRSFAATMRTRNRNLRDLLPDEEQLARLGLPVWRTEADVARALGLDDKTLRGFAVHREREQVLHYVTFAIPKRSGGERLIMAPKTRLKAAQRALHAILVEKLPVSEHAHGFRKARSVRTNAAPHVAKKTLVKLDLADFFPSVTFPRVRGLLIALGYGFPVATCLAVLMTEAARQPVEIEGRLYHVPIGPRHAVQGAPTSPGLANALVLRLDHRLAGLARKFDCAYTRYADDLAFSGDLDRDAANRLRARAEQIIVAEGFRVRDDKTRIQPRAGRQRVAGVTVNKDLGLSREERRRLRAEIHQIARDRAAGVDVDRRIQTARGRLAYLAMLNPAQAEPLAARLAAAIAAGPAPPVPAFSAES